MLKFQIDDSELEETIQNNFGNNTDRLVQEFISFIREKKIKEDVSVSVEQLNQGKGIPMSVVMEDLRNKYE